MGELKKLAGKVVSTFKDEGVKSLVVKTRNWTIYQIKQKKDKQHIKDILFINGCSIDYCERYRVHHKMEELRAFGVTCDELSMGAVNEDLIKCYRGFVIYRAPHTPALEKFVKSAQKYNKTVFYDIDDLIFDLKYTSNVDVVKKMSKEEKKLHDDGVVRYGKMLKLCDYGITTTKALAEEMEKFGVKEVGIDKNVAGLKMQECSEKAIKQVKRREGQIVIGYASGSMTHNEDFEMIKPALIRILRKYPNVILKLVGALEVPEVLQEFGERVVTAPFVDYTKLPFVIRSFDINLAPLTNTLFNRAKSSIKWMEAGLVQVPTVASDVGDFHDSIMDGVDGVLCCENEWFEKIEELILNEKLRNKIGMGAYETVLQKYVVTMSGKTISDFIMEKLHKNVYFVLPGMSISGGIMVAMKHIEILRKNGFDVTIINLNKRTAKKISDDLKKMTINLKTRVKFTQHVDMMVATMWLTLPKVLDYPFCNDKRYLVQGKEPDFYELPSINILDANATYNIDGMKYLTISKWCKKWLEEDFGKKAKYAPNGICMEDFKIRERKCDGKIKILIEGSASSQYKNVDESFRIAQKLDSEKYEIIYLSYRGKPKKWYKIDKIYKEIEHKKVSKVYEEADILLKSSLLESFSYPPLEMMATGGLVVARPNEGNVEYLKDEENCLLYTTEDEAVEKIERLVQDAKLREKLVKNGLETARARDWGKIEPQILELYK